MNNFLLDTNALLWYFWGSARIGPVEDLIASEENDIFVSPVSLWEIAIKIRIGKFPLVLDELRSFAREYAFSELPVTGDSVKEYLKLPNLHKDPFDHMLLAQAISRSMRFITGDSLLAAYSPLVMVI
ncbi:MAG: type II toxin-antitoxin system VapC family toxin [Treponema sp.]|jgi:PIN domain nuclease of toxin-antitoxin system|nr:type II toxin-antitoxin system VapC family toxin [Treponema sp.]